MQESPVCRGCLSVDGKFSSIHEFSTAQAYENLIGIPLLPSDRFPQHVCSFCLRMLQRFVEFKARCHKVLEVLHQAQVQGTEITKEYSCSLTESYPSLKPTYVRTKTITLDVFVPTKPTKGRTSLKRLAKELTTKSRKRIEKEKVNFKKELEVVDSTVLNDFEVEKKERLSDIEADNDDTDLHYEDTIEPKSEDEELKVKPLEIFIKSEVLNKKTRKVKKEAKRKELTDKIRKRYIKKKIIKVTKSDRQIVIDYAKSTGFDIAFLSRSEQIQEVEQKKQETDGHNCNQCGKHFDAASALDRHQKNYHVFKPDSFMCDICSCLFRNKRTLRSHLTNHSWVFTCQTCNFKTKQRPVLRKHQNFHEGKRYPCKYCDKVFDKTTSYFSHVRLKHAAELSYCELCGEFFISEKGVENHKKLTHSRFLEEFPSKCRDCDRRFRSIEALDRHTAVKGCTLPSCVQCGDAFTNEYFLKYHLVQRHFDNISPESFHCDQCQIRFYSHSALVRHTCGAKLSCVQCGDSFENEPGVLDHMALRHHIFKCEEVMTHGSETWSLTMDLIRKLKIAQRAMERAMLGVSLRDRTEMRKLAKATLLCGKQFTNAAYFKKHYSLIHSGRQRRPRGRQPLYGDLKLQMQHRKFPKMKDTIRKWRVVGERGLVAEKHAPDGSIIEKSEFLTVICEVCGKGFRNSTELKTHQRFHFGENLFTCSHCSKGFKQRVQLQMHERVHTGERPYKCPECPKAFKTYQAYTRHYLVHSGVRKHVCQICEKTFQTSTATKMHIKTVHMKIPMPPRIRNRRYKE